MTAIIGALFREIMKEMITYIKSHKHQIYKRMLKLARHDAVLFLAFVITPLSLSTLMFNQIIERLIPSIGEFMNSFLGGTLIFPLFASLFVSFVVYVVYDALYRYRYYLDPFYDPLKWANLLAMIFPIILYEPIMHCIWNHYNAVGIVGNKLVKSSNIPVFVLVGTHYVAIDRRFLESDF